MKYMTFPSSCSFCCISNMLEYLGVDVSDRDVIIGAGLPYRFQFDSEENCFSTGAMLQAPFDYNRFLKKYGLCLIDNTIKKENTLRFLLTHNPCMVGIASQFGKHAMIFTEKTAEGYHFLNPHKENDGQADFVVMKEGEVLARLSGINHIGYIERGSADTQEDVDNTIPALNAYRAQFLDFCKTKQTAATIAVQRDRLLRPVALDLPVMMSIVGETAIAEKLYVLQNQIFQILRMEECVPSDFVNRKLFEEVIGEYRGLVEQHKTKCFST